MHSTETLTFWRVFKLTASRIGMFAANSKAIEAVGTLILLKLGPWEKSEIWAKNRQEHIHWSIIYRIKEKSSWCRSLVKGLPGKGEALGLIPSIGAWLGG